VCGEAVEHDRVRRRGCELPGVDAVRGEVAEPPLVLVLLAHARPDVRVEHPGPGDRLGRVDHDLDARAGLCRILPARRDDRRVGKVALR